MSDERGVVPSPIFPLGVSSPLGFPSGVMSSLSELVQTSSTLLVVTGGELDPAAAAAIP